MTATATRRLSAFPTTHWSVVLATHGPTGPSRDAIAALCESYWRPLYAYLRRQGCNVDDAHDLVQGFFTRLLEKNAFWRADPDRGRFRVFLITSLNNFVTNERDRRNAKKRGGQTPTIPFASGAAEQWYQAEPSDHLTPERIYERRWALTALGRVMSRLRAEYVRAGKLPLFDGLKSSLIRDDAGSCYAEVGARLGTTPGAARVAAHRLRRRYVALLREEIAHTVSSADEVDPEIRYLLNVVGS